MHREQMEVILYSDSLLKVKISIVLLACLDIDAFEHDMNFFKIIIVIIKNLL